MIEFSGDQGERKPSNAIGFRHVNTGNIATIVAGTNTNRYRVQSNDQLSITLIVQQLLARLNLKSSITAGNIVTSIGQNHLQLIQNQIDIHFTKRQNVKRISVSWPIVPQCDQSFLNHFPYNNNLFIAAA